MRLLVIFFLIALYSCSKEDETNGGDLNELRQMEFSFKIEGQKYKIHHQESPSRKLMAVYNNTENYVTITGRRYYYDPDFTQSQLVLFIKNPVKGKTYELNYFNPSVNGSYSDSSFACFIERLPYDTQYFNGRPSFVTVPCYSLVNTELIARVTIVDFWELPDFKGHYGIEGHFEMTVVSADCDSLDHIRKYPKRLHITEGKFYIPVF